MKAMSAETGTADRELIELAAKAAMIMGHWDGRGFNVSHPLEDMQTYWEPLDDDGDALRLMVKLGLDVDVHREAPDCGVSGVEVRGYVYRRLLVTEPASDNNAALETATRRAIVLAAAEIGSRM